MTFHSCVRRCWQTWHLGSGHWWFTHETCGDFPVCYQQNHQRLYFYKILKMDRNMFTYVYIYISRRCFPGWNPMFWMPFLDCQGSVIEIGFRFRTRRVESHVSGCGAMSCQPRDDCLASWPKDLWMGIEPHRRWTCGGFSMIFHIPHMLSLSLSGSQAQITKYRQNFRLKPKWVAKKYPRMDRFSELCWIGETAQKLCIIL